MGTHDQEILKSIKRSVIGICLFFGLIILFNLCTFTVTPDSLAIVSRFGEMQKMVVRPEDEEMVIATTQQHSTLQGMEISTKRGLHFKVPFIDSVEIIEGKLLTYESGSEIVNLKGNLKLDMQMFAQYSVVNPAIYKMRVGSISNSLKNMDDLVFPVVIQTANSSTWNEFFEGDTLYKKIEEKTAELNAKLEVEYGLHISDIGIHRKNYPETTVASIEEKMIKEIEKESSGIRAEGESHYNQSVAETKTKQSQIINNAKEESAEIIAQAEKEAMAIYEEALRKDLGFYQFIQRMNAYENVEGQTLFFESDNAFLSMMQGY